MLQQRSVALICTSAIALVGLACSGDYLTNVPPDVESENPALQPAFSSSGQTAKLFIADAFGTVLLRYDVTDGGGAVADGSVNTVSSVRGIAFSPSGEMFTSVSGGTIRRFLDPEGAATPNGVIDAGNTGAPFGAVQWSDFRASELFQAQESGTVLRFTFDASGNPAFNGTVTAGGATRGLRVNPITTELFVSNLSNTVHRFLFDAAGNATSNGAVVGGLNHSHGMVFTPWGELLVANFNANNVARFTFDASGNAVANGVISGGDMAGPLDLDMSPWGELFVTNHNQNPGKVTRWVFTSQDASATAVYNGSFTVPTNMGVMRFAGAATGGVYDGTLFLTSQAEVDAFPYREVTGSLLVGSSGISDLSGLSTLTTVGGNLGINSTLATSLHGLHNVSSVASMNITGNDNLTSVTALSNVAPDLLSLHIIDNDALQSLAGLEGLTSLQTLTVIDNELLVDLSALGNVYDITHRAEIRDNAALVDLGLAALTTTPSLRIEDNPSLAALGLPSLTSVGELEIQRNASLPDLQGLDNLVSAGGPVRIADNVGLSGVGGLSSLTSAFELAIVGNLALTNLDGLSSLTSLQRLLVIVGNTSLTDLDGLSSLTSVRGLVTITDNGSLANLDGLSALTAITAEGPDPHHLPGDLTVTDNSTLGNCQGIASLISGGGVAGTTTIQNNASGCNSVAEVTSPPVYTGDLTLYNQAEVDAFNYGEVTGNLEIAGADVTDLSALSSLTTVGGVLTVAGVDATSFSGLDNLTSAANLIIQNNSTLVSIAALANLGPTVGGVYVTDNDVLTTVTGLEGLTTVNGQVHVTRNPALVDLSGLANVTEVTQVVTISDNAGLVGIGLTSLTTIGQYLYIQDNPALADLSGLSALTSTGSGYGVFIDRNGSLVDLQGLENLQSTGGMQVTENAGMSSLDGLSGLSTAELLIVRSNPVLADLDGVSTLTSVHNLIQIVDNPVLANLNGLSGVTAIVPGFAQGDLTVTGNTTLADCIGIVPLLSSGGVPGTVDIQNNATGCNSIAEITADYTPTGTDVPVSPIDQTTGAPSPISLTFDNVTSSGETTVSSSQVGGGGGPPPPANFRLGQPPTKFDIQTTATFSGSVEVCIGYSGVSYGNESKLKILHFDDATQAWEDVTTSLDTTNDIICGEVTSFSPFLVAEENVAPVVTSVGLPADPIAVGTSTQITADFLDDNPGDVHTATIDWGDGAITAGTVTEPSGGTAGTVSGIHTYSEAGVYTVTVTVTEDVDPASDLSGSRSSTEETTVTFVVVYDPDGGFVTGGGWIDSPAGAYADDPTLTGKANFGFVSKYKKGASTPTGNTEFHFKTGDLNFHSSAYDWLVVNQGGSNAQFRGSGTINGSVAPNGADYKFMIWAGDDDPDTFRIKIWYEDSAEVVVFDNGFNQTIGGGSIKVHQN